MSRLPTCWYCPACGGVYRDNFPTPHHSFAANETCEGIPVEVPIILPGTPLTEILKALNIEHREGWLHGDTWDTGFTFTLNPIPDDLMEEPQTRVLVVDNPATDEARDG